jgi:putative protein kinase ArgK-like GTPase of G3E family
MLTERRLTAIAHGNEAIGISRRHPKADRVALGRALSLIESQRPEDIPVRAALLNSLPLKR